MASIYKREKDGPYYIAYYPAPRKRKVVCGSMDRKATEALARKLETEAFNRRRGIVDERADRAAKQQTRALSDHVDDFERYLLNKGSGEKHATQTARYVRQILNGIEATQWSSITLDVVEGWLADRQRENTAPAAEGTERINRFGASTRNHYMRAIKSFTKWMTKDNRALHDPLTWLGRVNTEVDVRIKRRVLSFEDLQALLTATATGPERYGLTGPERVLVYRLALATGLRASEIASLTVGDFHLNAFAPVVEVQACYSKNGRRDELPLRLELAAELQTYLSDRPGSDSAFPKMPCSDRTAPMLKADLDAAGIDFKTDEGRYDFHALRHQFCSDLVASGANVKVAQTLARHSNPTLTIGLYSHTQLHDRHAAVRNLPDLSARDDGAEGQKATGTDDAVARQIARRGPDAATVGKGGHIGSAAIGCGRPAENAESLPAGHSLAIGGNAGQAALLACQKTKATDIMSAAFDPYLSSGPLSQARSLPGLRIASRRVRSAAAKRGSHFSQGASASTRSLCLLIRRPGLRTGP